MHATARRPLWVRVGAGILALILFLTNTVYPWISLLPAPPIVVAQEGSPLATTSAEATPAASVATPAPSPLDPLDQLENEILLSTNSAETVPPEEPPESTPSASSAPIPEVPPEDQTSTPSATPSPNLGSLDLPASLPSPSPSTLHKGSESSREMPPDAEQSGRLPPPLDPFLISLKYPFVGTYPISYGFGDVSGSSYVRLMQSIFDVDAHDGLDFAMPEGTSVIATGPGEVTYAGNGLYGVTVIIRHSWGNSYYGHLSLTSVTVGDKVTTGQEVGLSGNTGISTAPHLHFGIRPNHYDPYNGYHGMIDPLPYLTGTVLGTSTKHDLIHLPYKTLDASDASLSIPVIASSSAGLTYTLKNPRGESRLVYPSIYNYGTGDTAILPRPTPFIPGEYTLTVTNQLGESDVIKFSWGVLTLNTNQSRYQLGQTAKLALAVLDEVGEMVCDADLILNVTSPTGAVETLTTDNTLITRNIAVCQSKDLTLTPDYEGSFTPSEVGTHNITLTAITPKHTFTMTDSFEVVETLPYTLERLATTRIFPGNVYPVILKVTAHQDLNSQLVEQVPNGFSTTPAGSTDFAPWVSPDDLATIHPSPYTRTENSSSQSLSWDLDLKTNQSVILGYTYDAPDESPALYSLGPISYAGVTEARSWNLAIDGVDPTLGYFSPPSTWTSVGDSNISLPYPDPRNGDLVLAAVAVRPSSITIDTPGGWTSLGSWSGSDGGAEGVDTGSVKQYWFYKTADGTEGSSTQTFTKTGTASVITGNIMQIRSGTGTYDLSAGGYSINADATNWNGTLDTDIGTRDGDLIILTGAQNGDLSNTSAWNITATNLITKSTVNEHGEFANTTGNDIEVGLATTQVWEGNNTTTPAITLTQSVAASGVVTAIRIRQGSGTNRSDTWVRAAGRQLAGTTSVAPSYPEHDYGDLLLLFVGSRASADNTPTTPTGWTSLGSYNGGVGTFGADAGNSRSTVFYREATARLTGTITVSITSGNTAIGQIISVHRDDAESWVLDSDGGTDSTAGTSWSTTGSGIDLDSADGGDLLLVGNSINTDAYTYSSYGLSASGITFGDVTETSEFITTNGNDMALSVGTGRVTAGSASNVAPTFTMTSSGSGTNAPAGSSIFVKVSSTSNTTSTKAVGFFTPPATWTSAADANLSLTYPDPRNGDLMVAVTAIRPAASTVNTPSGWTLVDSRTGTDGGAEGADTGSVGIYVFTKTSDGTEGTGTLAFTETGTTSVWIGNIMKVRSGTGTYSVSASGYSLNGDTVTWGSTLGSDIGLTNGDLVLLAAAQNGDLSATSAWDISATGVTQKSTFNEHGEFGSTTGNDIEVGLASGMIWGGTNSATPTLTLTQSVAASGVVSAIRIREDTGTQRTDTWVRSASAQVVSTTTTLSLVYPEHEVGDMFVMFVSTRGTSDPTLLAPYGWTSLGSYNGGAGTFGADAGNARTTAYYREATSRRWGTQAVALTSADVAIGQILAIHTKDIDTWTIDSDGGTDTSAGTGWSVTGSGIDLSSSDGGDVVLIGSAINTDAYTYSAHALSASGITFGEVTQTATYNTTSGNDANLNIVTSRVTSGTGSGAPTLTMTASGSTANAPAGSSLFVSIKGTPSTMTVSGTANGNDGATVKVALGASVQAQTTTISSGTWTIADVTKPSVGTAVTVWVDSVADNLESTAVTLYNSSPISDLVLNTNVLSLGSNQDQSLSLTNLNSYDCSEDEDIMHQAASSHLKIEGDACESSATNSYTAEKLDILSGNTLNVSGTETLTTYDLAINGTLTSTGNSTYNVSHDWNNAGTFTSSTSTVNLNGSPATTQTLTGNTSFNNLSATNTGVGSDWYNSSWSYRQKITIDNTKVGGANEVFDIGNETGDFGEYTTTNIDNGDLSISTSAALNGSIYGLSAHMDDTTSMYARKSAITQTEKYRYRFYFDPNTTTMGDSEVVSIQEWEQNGGTDIALVYLYYYTATGYQLRFYAKNDASANVLNDPLNISDAPHYIEISATRAVTDTSSDGTYEWWVDGVSQGSITGVDNYNLLADQTWRMTLGVSGVDAGTNGTFYWDDIVANSDGSPIGPVLTDFPIYVDLADLPSTFHSHVNQTDARDIRVTKGDGTTELPREVVSYTAASDTGELHFKYSGTLSSSVDTDVYIYYGNSGASDYATTDTYGRNNVWDDVYNGVWHLNETSGSRIDSTGNNNTLTDNNSVSYATGIMGTAADFERGSSQYLSITDGSQTGLDATTNFSLTAWHDLENVSASASIVAKGDFNDPEFYEIGIDSGASYSGGYSRVYSNWSEIAYLGAYPGGLDDMTFVGLVHNGSADEESLYIDGSPADNATGITVDPGDNSADFIICANVESRCDGITDEVRFAPTALGSTWLSTEYNNQSSPSTFYSGGTEELRPEDRTVRFTAGTTQTITGTWTVTGSTNALIILESSTTSAWTINPTAASVSYADISYSTNTGVGFCATYSTNSGNNTGWSISSGSSCNTAPDVPTSLLQLTTSDVTLSTGDWHNSTSIKFTATATDTDNPDTLYLCVEADALGNSFSNTEDSCGSGVAYSGSGVTVSHTLTLTDATEYHWQVRVKDTAGAYSSWVSYDVNAESARDVGVDTTAPTGGTVYDGTGVGVDTTFATSSLSALSANWASFNTDVSGLLRYDYSIGTSAGATDVKAWTDNTTSTSVTATGLTLQTSQMYYFNVRAVDNAGNVQSAVSSNGQLVSPSISFAITPATATFSNLNAGNSYTDTEVATLTTSTNAYNGYVIRAFTTDLLKSLGGTHQIANFSAGSYASPATWAGSETGFGYTSSDTSIQGSDKFGSGTLYAPFSQTGPGDIVADHTSTVTGTSISNESFNITYKVKVPSSQAATNYTSTVVYTATAQY